MPLPVRARTAGPLRWVKKPIMAGRTKGQASSIATEPKRASGPLSRQNWRRKQRCRKLAGVPSSGRPVHSTAAPLPNLTISSACMTGLGERAGAQALEHAQRRALGFAHGLHVEPEGLLEGILALEGAVQHVVGEQHPGRAGWEFDHLARGVLLIVGIDLGDVAQLAHDVVIGGAEALGDAELLQ